MSILKTVVFEEEKLNKKGEYVKIATQSKYFLGILVKKIEQKMYNKITQAVLDSVETDEIKKGKNIGFGN